MRRDRPTGTAVARLLLVGLVAVLAIGCSPARATGTPGPGGSPGPSGTPGPALTVAALKLHLIDRLGPRWYCDPDFYPLARADELTRALEIWPEVVTDAEALTAIRSGLSIQPGAGSPGRSSRRAPRTRPSAITS